MKQDNSDIKTYGKIRGSANNTKKHFFKDRDGVKRCKVDLSKYFHPPDLQFETKINILYRLADVNDFSFSRMIGVDKSSMNRYRRRVWTPNDNLKIKICQKLSELIGKQVDTMMLWGNHPFLDIPELKPADSLEIQVEQDEAQGKPVASEPVKEDGDD